MSCCCCCFKCLEPNDPILATTSRFISQGGFICYKTIMSAYFVFWSVYWPMEENITDSHKFVTYWTFYIATLYFLVSCVNACVSARQHLSPTAAIGPVRGVGGVGGSAKLSSCRSFLLCFQIVTWNIACVASLVVVTVFWITLYQGDRLSSTDINAHILIAVIMGVDQLLVATKFERKQMWASFVFAVMYTTFNVAWFLTAPEDERVIYTVLDWEDDASNAALFTVINIFVVFPLFGLVHYAVFRLREWLNFSSSKSAAPSGVDIESGKFIVTGTLS